LNSKGEVIIEYVGELIDDALADIREAYYNSKNIGCYMFRITDSTRIVDATMRGSIARFINHSCGVCYELKNRF
jgi:SET domain-containing protein